MRYTVKYAWYAGVDLDYHASRGRSVDWCAKSARTRSTHECVVRSRTARTLREHFHPGSCIVSGASWSRRSCTCSSNNPSMNWSLTTSCRAFSVRSGNALTACRARASAYASKVSPSYLRRRRWNRSSNGLVVGEKHFFRAVVNRP